MVAKRNRIGFRLATYILLINHMPLLWLYVLYIHVYGVIRKCFILNDEAAGEKQSYQLWKGQFVKRSQPRVRSKSLSRQKKKSQSFYRIDITGTIAASLSYFFFALIFFSNPRQKIIIYQGVIHTTARCPCFFLASGCVYRWSGVFLSLPQLSNTPPTNESWIRFGERKK